MNDEAKQLLQFLIETLKDGKAFVYEQAPDIAKEILTRGIVFHSTIIISLLILFFINVFIAIKCKKINKKQEIKGERKYEDVDTVMWISIVVSVIAIIATVVHCYYLLLIYLTPKLYILEQLTQMMKG